MTSGQYQVYFKNSPIRWYPRWRTELDIIVDRAKEKLDKAMGKRSPFFFEPISIECDLTDNSYRKLIELLEPR